MFEKLQKYYPVRVISAWYARFERPISSLSLVGGFVFDAFFLKRADQFKENFWIVVHLLIVAICIVLVNREENEGADAIAESWNPAKLHFWIINIMQFFFGGLLSTFLVFYFRSAVLQVTWPFFIILAAAFVANESLKRHYARLSFQISFFFLCVFLFMIYLVPVLTHRIGPVYFLISGLASLAILAFFLFLLRRFAKAGIQRESRRMLMATIIGIFVIVNGLYFLDLIPPLPLALQASGIFHSISRTDNTAYSVSVESQGTGFWNEYGAYFGKPYVFHEAPNDYIYAYTAVFSPLSLDTDILHVWQYYDTSTKKWVTDTTVNLSVAGGRDGGYRTYSIMQNLAAGKWRVNVTTPSGQLIGRILIDVVPVTTEATVSTVTVQ